MNVDDDLLLALNGLDGDSGAYLTPPLTLEEASRLARGEVVPNVEELEARKSRDGDHLGAIEGVETRKLEQAGWGVIWAHDTPADHKEALRPLIERRREQATGRLFKQIDLHPGETKLDLTARFGADGLGLVNPAHLPYYLLLVGSPESIPFDFQYQLDVQYAVGRLYFENAEDYAQYAQNVIAAETGAFRQSRRATLFGVANPDDIATARSHDDLIVPLSEWLTQDPFRWQPDAILRGEATRARLTQMLGGNPEEVPAFLLTASHGMGFQPNSPRLFTHTGALVCQDWPGPKWKGSPREFYFCAEDLPGGPLNGMIAMFFACYGAGCPATDDFAPDNAATKAVRPFLSTLPRRMLAQKDGALAVVAHVDRAWDYSFRTKAAGPQLQTFQSAIRRLLEGHPIGSAMEPFNARYAECASELSQVLMQLRRGRDFTKHELRLFITHRDSRNYSVMGDPAARLGPLTPLQPKPREVTESITFEGPGEAKPVPQPALSTQAEPLWFRAYHPRTLRPGESQALLVYTHLESALNAVAKDAGQQLGERAMEFRHGDGASTASIAEGVELTLIPRGAGLTFQPPAASFPWSGPWRRMDFRVQADASRAGHVTEAAIACYAGPLLIADIRMPFVVCRPGEPTWPDEPREQTSAKTYQTIFASYSHNDAAILEAVEKAYKALGVDYSRDVMTLKSGQRWSDQLLTLIEHADVFQLFWSASAADSAYVEQEWRHALTIAPRKGDAFIRPVYWEQPMPRVPAELSSIHFAPVDFGCFQQPAKTTPKAPRLPGGATDLTVSTYAGVAQERLVARTRLSLNGDVDVSLSADPDDARFFELHQNTVRAALDARLAYLRLLGQQES